ncbi:MAG: hypothetical protein KAS04_04835 [Candidatus Aenigmarchaeota archaeon]|nr:hypothetical protein [Candidatus Aenigmarchaeota archaeon]
MKISKIFNKKEREIPLKPETKLQAKQMNISDFGNEKTVDVMEKLNIDSIILEKR